MSATENQRLASLILRAPNTVAEMFGNATFYSGVLQCAQEHGSLGPVLDCIEERIYRNECGAIAFDDVRQQQMRDRRKLEGEVLLRMAEGQHTNTTTMSSELVIDLCKHAAIGAQGTHADRCIRLDAYVEKARSDRQKDARE